MKTFVARRWDGAHVVQEKKIKAKNRRAAEKQFQKDPKLTPDSEIYRFARWVGDYYHVDGPGAQNSK